MYAFLCAAIPFGVCGIFVLAWFIQDKFYYKDKYWDNGDDKHNAFARAFHTFGDGVGGLIIFILGIAAFLATFCMSIAAAGMAGNASTDRAIFRRQYALAVVAWCEVKADNEIEIDENFDFQNLDDLLKFDTTKKDPFYLRIVVTETNAAIEEATNYKNNKWTNWFHVTVQSEFTKIPLYDQDEETRNAFVEYLKEYLPKAQRELARLT